MQQWAWQQLHNLLFLTVPAWQDNGAKAVFTTRRGGSSSGAYCSLNLGLHVGDDRQPVLANRRRLVNLFGFSLEQMVSCQQVHGNAVGVVQKGDSGKGALSDEEALKGWDAMVTAEPGLVLTTFYADCIPLFFFDPEEMVIGIAHSGWKGTYLRIAEQTVQAMVGVMGCNPAQIEVFIGPGVGPCCYQIQAELADKVKDSFADFNDIIYEDKEGYFWDLKTTNEQILISTGILESNIIKCPLCTSCDEKHFFSYRRDQGITGRMGAAIALTSECT